MIIAGSALLVSTAIPGLAAGAYCMRHGSDSLATLCTRDDGVAALSLGVVALLVGAPLLTFGALRAKRYAAWTRQRRISLAPHTGRTAQGTPTAGLRLRF